jgi:hypothetical protein
MVGILLPAGSTWPDEVAAWANSFSDMVPDVLAVQPGTPSWVLGDVSGPEYDGLKSRIYEGFMRFAVPDDPDAVDVMVDKVREAALKISKNSADGLLNPQQLIGPWQGAAADGFEIYLGQMKDAVDLQRTLLTELGVALKAYGALVEAMQDDLHDLISTAATGLHNASLTEQKVGMNVSGTIAYVISEASSGEPLGVFAAIFNGVLNTEKDLMDASSKPEVMLSLAGGLESLADLVEDEMKRIVKGFDYIRDHVKDDLPTLRPAKPALVTRHSFDPADFALDSAEFDHHTVGVSRDDLVAEPAPKPPKKKIEEPYPVAGHP